MRLQSKHEWRKDVLPLLFYMVTLAYFVLHPSFKRSFFVGKSSNLLYFLRSCFTKSVLLFRNNAARFHCKIQRRELVIFSHTLGISNTEVTSKTRFDILLREGGGFMKNIAMTLSVPKSIYECLLNQSSIFYLVCFLHRQILRIILNHFGRNDR